MAELPTSDSLEFQDISHENDAAYAAEDVSIDFPGLLLSPIIRTDPRSPPSSSIISV